MLKKNENKQKEAGVGPLKIFLEVAGLSNQECFCANSPILAVVCVTRLGYFWKIFSTNFPANVAQIIGYLGGSFENGTFEVKTTLDKQN